MHAAPATRAACLVVDVELGATSGPQLLLDLSARGLAFPAILMSASGEAMTRKQGVMFDRLTSEAVAKYKSDPKHTILQLSPAMQAKWSKDAAAIEADWVKQGAGREKVLAKFRELLTEAQAAK